MTHAIRKVTWTMAEVTRNDTSDMDYTTRSYLVCHLSDLDW